MSSASARVLVVDDTDDVRELYAEYLHSCGYEVLQAADGNEAVNLVHAHHPAVVVMDLAMPVMDGRTATRILKADNRTKGIHIIVVTGNATPEHLQAAREAGCDALLLKPLPPDALSSAIQHVLRGEAVPTNAPLR